MNHLLTLTDSETGEASVSVGASQHYVHLFLHQTVFTEQVELELTVDECDELIEALMEAGDLVEQRIGAHQRMREAITDLLRLNGLDAAQTAA